MDIRIKRIELENFKCFRTKILKLDRDITVIRGRNGEGKTTIADAILWCLFGKNTMGQSDFSIKTKEDGVEIPHLDHSVELFLEADGDYSIKRTLKETWVKKRGSNEQVFKNNTTEYMINGEVMTATDFKKKINSLIPEDIFRIVTNPLYFPSLKWQEQRAFLSTLAGDVEDDLSDNEDLLELSKKLEQNKEDIVAYRKHLSYRIKEVKEKIKQVPVRLEEQHKALPEAQDWDKLQAEYEVLIEKSKGVSGQILTIKSGNGGEIEKEKIRQQIREVDKGIDSIEERATKTIKEARADLDSKINVARAKFSEITRNKADLDSKIMSYDSLMNRCNETLEQCEQDADEIRRLWAENNKKFDASTITTTCPTCGQYLPDSQIQEKIEQMRTNFNKNQEGVKQGLREKAEKVKKLKADTEKQLEELKAQKDADLETALRLKNELNAQYNELADLEHTPIGTFEDMLIGDKEYSALLTKKKELQNQYESAGMDDKTSDELLNLEADYLELQKQIDETSKKLVSKVQYDRICDLIEGIKQDQKVYVSTLTKLEQEEDIAKMYQDRQNAILEENINKHFELVKWKMFKTVNNGGEPFDDPYCECYIDGVAYHDGLNQAARLNAGLDIISTLCKHYGVTAPIVIDNSESVNLILPTESQQIRLEVSQSELEVV